MNMRAAALLLATCQVGVTATHAADALSTDEEAYLAGKGMGLGKVAELNGYPGPAHVLSLVAELQLSPVQVAATQAVFDSMQTSAKLIGHELVERERALDRLFAGQTATSEAMRKFVEDIGSWQAKLRAVHLEAHLAQARILTAKQNAKYRELRGYSPAHSHEAHQVP